jgi:hypothetical protein
MLLLIHFDPSVAFHDDCRQFVRESGESKSLEVELFLNSVPLLAGLSREEKQRLLDAFDEQTFAKGQRVINEVRTWSVR